MLNTDYFIAQPNAVHELYTDIAGVPFPAGIQAVQGIQGVQGVQGEQGTQGV